MKIKEEVDYLIQNLNGTPEENAAFVIDKILDATKQEKHIMDRSCIRKITLFSSFWMKMKEEIEKRGYKVGRVVC